MCSEDRLGPVRVQSGTECDNICKHSEAVQRPGCVACHVAIYHTGGVSYLGNYRDIFYKLQFIVSGIWLMHKIKMID